MLHPLCCFIAESHTRRAQSDPDLWLVTCMRMASMHSCCRSVTSYWSAMAHRPTSFSGAMLQDRRSSSVTQG